MENVTIEIMEDGPLIVNGTQEFSEFKRRGPIFQRENCFVPLRRIR